MFDVIVVGSGAAGTWASYQLEGKKVLMLDVGLERPPKLPYFNIHEQRKSEGSLSLMVGSQFQGLINLDREVLTPKLKAPLMRFITDKPSQGHRSIEAVNFNPVISYAQGGLANGWGAGAYEFNDQDLHDFPIKKSDLSQYYKILKSKIGISGRKDDLSDYLGDSDQLQPPAPLNWAARTLIESYQKNRNPFKENGLKVGMARLATISQSIEGRKEFFPTAAEFFRSDLDYIYTPTHTIHYDLLKRADFQLTKNKNVTGYQDLKTHVRIFTEDTIDGKSETFEAKKLILCAGAINTGRIVLSSNQSMNEKIPIRDNPVSFIPFVNLSKLGSPFESDKYSVVQTHLLYQGERSNEPIIVSFYPLSGPMRSDLLFEFPLSIQGQFLAAKYVLPAMAMAQVFYPDTGQPRHFLSLNRDRNLKIEGGKPDKVSIEKPIISALRSAGFFSHPVLCRYPLPGSAIHYAGCLPMKNQPEGPFQTDPNGRLNLTQNVYVADGACFTNLPSKNLTLTIMANAMRIAENVKRSIQ